MEIKTKDVILGVVAAIGVYYVYNKFIKKSAPAPVSKPNPVVAPAPKSNSVTPQPIADGTINPYPVGEVLSSNQTGNVDTGVQVQLKEGDAIKGIPETIYVLKDGKKHPVSGAWWIYHYGENFNGTFIQLSDFTVSLIPTGDTFTINGQ
jgi:hypothetical protein